MIDASQNRFRVQGFTQPIVEKAAIHSSDEAPARRLPSSHKDASRKLSQRLPHVVIDVQGDQVQADIDIKRGTPGPRAEESPVGSRNEPSDELDVAIGEMKAVADLVSQLNSFSIGAIRA